MWNNIQDFNVAPDLSRTYSIILYIILNISSIMFFIFLYNLNNNNSKVKDKKRKGRWKDAKVRQRKLPPIKLSKTKGMSQLANKQNRQNKFYNTPLRRSF